MFELSLSSGAQPMREGDVVHNQGMFMTRAAKDLSPDQKTAIESLLGRRVREDEEISIRTIRPPALPEQRRKELVEELKKYFAEVDARRHPGSAEQADEILDEAMRSVRPGIACAGFAAFPANGFQSNGLVGLFEKLL
jgi:hypothetical protein